MLVAISFLFVKKGLRSPLAKGVKLVCTLHCTLHCMTMYYMPMY